MSGRLICGDGDGSDVGCCRCNNGESLMVMSEGGLRRVRTPRSLLGPDGKPIVGDRLERTPELLDPRSKRSRALHREVMRLGSGAPVAMPPKGGAIARLLSGILKSSELADRRPR